MNTFIDSLVLFCCILDFGKGTKVLKLFKELGNMEGTIIPGKGTVSTEWLNILGVLDTRKEIFITVIDENLEDTLYTLVTNKFELNKPHSGIAFSIPLRSYIGVNKWEDGLIAERKDVEDVEYQSIFVIVNKGLSRDVLDAAESAGSTGGTIIHGRGAGTLEKAKIFNIEIEPEKDIILILSKDKNTDAIIKAIGNKIDIDKPNTGIIFTMDVSRTLGLYRGE